MRLWPVIISLSFLLSCGSPHAKIRGAIDARDSSSVDALLAGGEPPNAVVEYRYDELSLLALAARKGSAPIAKRLIEAGADVNLVFGEGYAGSTELGRSRRYRASKPSRSSVRTERGSARGRLAERHAYDSRRARAGGEV